MTTLLAPIAEQNLVSISGVDEDVEPDAQWKEALRARIEQGLQSMVDKVRQERDTGLRGLREGTREYDAVMKTYQTAMDRVRRIAEDQFNQELKIARFERSLALGKEIEGEEFEAFRRQQQAIWDKIKKDGAERPQGRQDSSVVGRPTHENGDPVAVPPRAGGEHDAREGPSVLYRDSRPPVRAPPPGPEYRPRDRTQSGGSDQVAGTSGSYGGSRPSRSRQNSSVLGADLEGPPPPGAGPYDQASIGRQGLSSLSRTRPQDIWLPPQSSKENQPVATSRTFAHATAPNVSPVSPHVVSDPVGRTVSRAGSIRSNERPSPITDMEPGSFLPRDRFGMGTVDERALSRKGKEAERQDFPPQRETQPTVYDYYARRSDSRMSMPITPARPSMPVQSSDEPYFYQGNPAASSRPRQENDDKEGIPVRSRSSRRSATSDQGSPENPRYMPSGPASARPIPNKRSFNGDFDSWQAQPSPSSRPYYGPQSPPAPYATSTTSRPIPRPPPNDDNPRRQSPSGPWQGSQSPPDAFPFAGSDLPFSSSPRHRYMNSPAGSMSGRRNSNGSHSVRSRSSRQEFWGPSDVSQRPLATFEEQSVASGSESEEDYGMDLEDLWHVRERQELTWKLVREQEEQARRKAQEVKRLAEEARRKEEEARRKEEEARRKEEEARRQAEEARRKEEEARRKEEEVKLKALEIQKREAELRRREAELARREVEAKLAEERRKREEAEAKLQEEIRKRQEAEEEAKRREQEEAKRREREEAERQEREAAERRRQEREEAERLRREREESERRERDRKQREEWERREREEWERMDRERGRREQEEKERREREAEERREREAREQREREQRAREEQERRQRDEEQRARDRREYEEQRKCQLAADAEAQAEAKRREEAERLQTEAALAAEAEARAQAQEAAMAAEAEALAQAQFETRMRDTRPGSTRSPPAVAPSSSLGSPEPDLTDELHNPELIRQQQAILEHIQAMNREAKRRAEEAKRQEEGRRRAEEEARKRAEEQAKRLAEEAARRLADEEARQRVDAENKRRLEVEEGLRKEREARKRFEEERRRKEEMDKQREDAILASVLRLSAEEEQRKQEERKRQESVGSSSDHPRPTAFYTSASSSIPRPVPIPGSSAGDRSSTASSASYSSSASFFSAASGRSSATGYSTSSTSRATATPTPGGTPTATPNVASTPKGAWKTSSFPQPGSSPATPSRSNTSSTYRTAFSSTAPHTPSSANQGRSATSFSPSQAEEEWARRQEELARQQFETFQRDQEAQQRRVEAKAMRQLTKEEVIKLFEEHERRWGRLLDMPILSWHSFPWPMLRPPSEPEQLTYPEVQAYVLSPHHPADKAPRDRIKDYLRKWHPDRFEIKLLPKVREDDREKVKEGAGAVARHLNKLLSSLSGSAENGLFG